MSLEILQVVFWLLVVTVGLVVYEVHESAKPPSCEHCAHCRAVRELELERRAESRGPNPPLFRRDDEDDRRP